MSTDDGVFDPDALPKVAATDPTLPGTLELGVFSLSLNVADLDASRGFYATLGFVETGGDPDDGWVILKNGETTLGLFSGMFERNMLTFNPGLTTWNAGVHRRSRTPRPLIAAGLDVDSAIEDGSSGAADRSPWSIPDGNPIIDQFF